jgi:predicted PurR-regulated permease PerM
MINNEYLFSWESLTRIVIMGILVLLCWKALPIVPVVLVSLVLTAAFYPIIKKVQIKTKIPLVLCIFLILILPIIPFIFLGFIFIPRIVAEVPVLLNSLNNIISHSSFFSIFLKDFNIFTYLQSHFDYTTATVNITIIIISIITTIILTFFMMYDLERLSELLFRVVPLKEKGSVKDLIKEIASVTGKYIRGNALISVICGVVVYIGLTLLGIPFALPLALFAAIFDLLPLVGQTIGAIPAVIIGFGVSPVVGLLVVILHFIYQQVENNIISPMIYNKALDLFPSVVFLSILLGASLFGILGAFLSLPVAASIPAIINYHKNYKIRNN